MNRRHAIAATGAVLPLSALGGVMDWLNGVKVGATLPDFDAEMLGAAPAPNPKLLLVDFWATWCGPCRAEFPVLNRLSQAHDPHDVGVLGLTQEPVAVAQAFLNKADIQYAVGAGGTKPLQKLLGIKALPYALIANRARTIVWRGQASKLTAQELSALLERAGS